MNILCIDAGVNAAIHLRQLRYLETHHPGLLARVNLIAGSSDGALVALFLAPRLGTGHSSNLRALDECIAFFDELLRAFTLTPRLAARWLTGRGPQAFSSTLEGVVRRHFEGQTLADLARRSTRVVAIAVDGERWARVTFRDFGFASEDEARRPLLDIALASCSFPALMAPYRSRVDGRYYLDGALLFSNPTLVALEEALEHLRHTEGTALERSQLERLNVLSFGITAGTDAARRLRNKRPLGLERLDLPPLMHLLARPLHLPERLLLGLVDIVDMQCKSLLGERYLRLQRPIPLLNYLLGVAFVPERLIQTLDAEATGAWCPTTQELDWVGTRWMAAPATAESHPRSARP
ncbi:patatin-like phospholipase family protein [Archangium sp.]|uniref:patatin-like phospholipase family protein n=1 Tax=Archangium sp. TaxID=1872627 RepID=UPI002D79E931|nr:patatin-like phospholipase family protein [Archangium sp.]